MSNLEPANQEKQSPVPIFPVQTSVVVRLVKYRVPLEIVITDDNLGDCACPLSTTTFTVSEDDTQIDESGNQAASIRCPEALS